MKAILMGSLCAALLAASAGTTLAQGYPTRIKLTCITTNANTVVKTKITEKDFIARCASDHSIDPARLRLFLVNGDMAVVDIVSSNVTCSFATFSADFPTNVLAVVVTGAGSNTLKGASFSPFNSLGESLLPADFIGTVVSSYQVTFPSNSVPLAALKGTIQGASVSNTTVYTGTISIGGKPFLMPE